MKRSGNGRKTCLCPQAMCGLTLYVNAALACNKSTAKRCIGFQSEDNAVQFISINVIGYTCLNE